MGEAGWAPFTPDDCLVVWGKKAFILGVDEIILPRIASYSEGMETLWITLTAR